jgi:diketogulonate reductase-like aldo/keto reductase
VAAIAAGPGRTPAQELLRWSVERGIAVIPKSVREERIRENAAIFDFELGPEDLARLDGLDRTGGAAIAVEYPWWTLRGRIRRVRRTAGRRIAGLLGRGQ